MRNSNDSERSDGDIKLIDVNYIFGKAICESDVKKFASLIYDSSNGKYLLIKLLQKYFKIDVFIDLICSFVSKFDIKLESVSPLRSHESWLFTDTTTIWKFASISPEIVKFILKNSALNFLHINDSGMKHYIQMNKVHASKIQQYNIYL
jgi:hypothetical protein